MDFKAQMLSGKAVETLPDGTQQAPFSYDFALDGKSLDHTVDDNGDLWIQGYASDFGVDRQEEAFEDNSFQRGLKTFLERNPIMLYHHQYDKALGQFTEAKVDERGLWVKGRVDAPAPGSWAEDVFNKIRKGTIRSFSVGGLFKRRMTKAGPRIYDVDLGEISVTPFPVNPRTTFSVIAKKAFEGVEGVQPPPIDKVEEEHEADECAECKARAAAEAAQAAAERETDEALLQRVIDRERKADEEAAAEAEAEKARQEAEAAAGKEREESEEEETDEEKGLSTLAERLAALAERLEKVSERWADEPAEEAAEEEQEEPKAEEDDNTDAEEGDEPKAE